MREEIVAQVVLDVAPDVEDQRARERAHHGLHERNHDDQRRVDSNLPPSPAVADGVDGPLQQVGHHHGQRRSDQQAGAADRVAPTVALQVSP